MRRRYKILTGVSFLGVAMLGSLAWALGHDAPCGAAPPLSDRVPSMRASVARCYGPPDLVRLESLAKPVPTDDQVLIRVHAASVNPLDWHYLRGKPYIMRPMSGYGLPNDVRMGVDVAGTVEAVGRHVSRFKVGDAVFGGANGSFAQYVTVRESGSLALKPDNVTFEQAAAVPIAAVTALQALRDKGRIQSGQRVLINGASGGVGTFAVQIAKIYGARVTGVCSTRNIALVSGLGADRVVDYTQQDFTQGPERYDLIVDNVGNHSLTDLRRVLQPHGILVMVGGSSDDPWIGALWGSIRAWFVAPFVTQRLMFLLARMNAADLEQLRKWLQAGTMTPAIDRQYALAEVPQAIRYLEAGHARAKVVIHVE